MLAQLVAVRRGVAQTAEDGELEHLGACAHPPSFLSLLPESCRAPRVTPRLAPQYIAPIYRTRVRLGAGSVLVPSERPRVSRLPTVLDAAVPGVTGGMGSGRGGCRILRDDLPARGRFPVPVGTAHRTSRAHQSPVAPLGVAWRKAGPRGTYPQLVPDRTVGGRPARRRPERRLELAGPPPAVARVAGAAAAAGGARRTTASRGTAAATAAAAQPARRRRWWPWHGRRWRPWLWWRRGPGASGRGPAAVAPRRGARASSTTPARARARSGGGCRAGGWCSARSSPGSPRSSACSSSPTPPSTCPSPTTSPWRSPRPSTTPTARPRWAPSPRSTARWCRSTRCPSTSGTPSSPPRTGTSTRTTAWTPRGSTRALWNNVRGLPTQGGSTLTQQYVERYYTGTTTSYLGKFKETILALKIDQSEAKDVILENYLNTIYFGRGAYGIEKAAQAYFGKPAADLTISESALIAGIIPAPSAWDPAVSPDRAEQRWNRVLDLMVQDGWITQADRDAAQYPQTVPPKTENTYGGAQRVPAEDGPRRARAARPA